MQDLVERTEGLRPEDLLADVTALRHSVAAARAVYAGFRQRIERPEFAASALNLAQYLALRQQELRGMQRQLRGLGLSTLGRSEGHVMACLDAVIATLPVLAGKQAVHAMPVRGFLRGEQRRARNADDLFGPPRSGRDGRIMVTLGTEAADDPQVIAGLASAGADVLRINCGHGDTDEWSRIIDNAGCRARLADARPDGHRRAQGPHW
jgi:pyruvate kinase